MEGLTKKQIRALVESVFEMQTQIEFVQGATYKFETKFIVRDDHLELKTGDILKVKEAQHGELDT